MPRRTRGNAVRDLRSATPPLPRSAAVRPRRRPAGVSQQEFAVPRRDGTRRIILPGHHVHVGDAPPELEDVRAGARGRRTGGGEGGGAGGDRRRHPVGPTRVHEWQEGGQLGERAEHAAVDGGEARVPYQLVAKGEEALPRTVDLLDRDPEELGVRDGGEDAVHGFSGSRGSTSGVSALPAELAPSMKEPTQLAKGSSGRTS